jgi:hypothetical protein
MRPEWTLGAFVEGQLVAASTTLTLTVRLNGNSGPRSARTLANWGLLTGEPMGIEAADRLFGTHYAPCCPDHF